MSTREHEHIQDTSVDVTPLAKETLAALVSTKFSRRMRELISLQDIANVIETLDLTDSLFDAKAPKLHIQRLRFTGSKRLHDQDIMIPIDYNQSFTSGVNVVLIEANNVGKSSIWKTIKFALTGDDSDYDADVRSWITTIWLVFTLNQHSYTIIVTRKPDGMHAILTPGDVSQSLEEALVETSVLFHAQGQEIFKQELQHFFFNHLSLTPLAWTNQASQDASTISVRQTSWRTYFQALLIPDGGDRYLLCDTQHSLGNQNGLIFSAFLGLSMAEPLNKLGVEVHRTQKEIKHKISLSVEEKRHAEEKILGLESAIGEARQRLATIATDQRTRRQAVENAEPNQQLIRMQLTFQEKNAEYRASQDAAEQLSSQIQQDRGRERQLREAIALQLHFTGITVTLCPNCDTAIDEDAVRHEQETATCRLCGKLAHTAPAEELVAMQAEADAYKQQVSNAEKERDRIWRHIPRVRQDMDTLMETIAQAQQAASQGITYALPTAEEDTERDHLLTTIGTFQRDLALTCEKATGQSPELQHLDCYQRIAEKVREVLREEAAARNSNKLTRLAELTQDMARRIGAESVTSISCSPYGGVKLEKHHQSVSFTGIKNEGERLRVKLAFFLAIMRLSREKGGGRHPGFLIIDQPGSNEMVPTDFNALAQVFQHIDHDFGADIQILCFTARPQFQNATDSARIYGPQNPPFAF
jgi:hypothetical protein